MKGFDLISFKILDCGPKPFHRFPKLFGHEEDLQDAVQVAGQPRTAQALVIYKHSRNKNTFTKL